MWVTMRNLRNKRRLQRVSRRQVGSREETSISPTIYRTWRERPSSISVMSGLWDWWRRVRDPTENGNVEESTTVNGTVEEIEEGSREEDEEEEEEDEKVYAEIGEILQNMEDQPKKNDGTSSEDDYDEVRELSVQESLKAGEGDAEKEKTEDEEEWSEDEEWERMYNGYGQVPTVSLALDIRTQRGVLREIERVGVPVYEPLPALHCADARLAPVYSTVVKPQSQRNSLIQTNTQTPLMDSPPPHKQLLLTQSDHSTAAPELEKPPQSKNNYSPENKRKSDTPLSNFSTSEQAHNCTQSRNVVESPSINAQSEESTSEYESHTPEPEANPPPNNDSEKNSSNINPHSDLVTPEHQILQQISQSLDISTSQSFLRDSSSSPVPSYLSQASLDRSSQLEIPVPSRIPSPKPPTDDHLEVPCIHREQKVSKDCSTLSLHIESSDVSLYQSSLQLEKIDNSLIKLPLGPPSNKSTKPTRNTQSTPSFQQVERSSEPSTGPEPPDDDPDHVYCDAEEPSEFQFHTVILKPPPLPTPDWEELPEKKDPAWKLGRIKRMKKWIGDSKVTTLPNRLSKMLSQDYLCHQGQSGFEDLRRYIKQGGDFCKELTTILQERAEAEAQYSKTLVKLSSKLIKATKEGSGTVNAAWHRIAAEMEAQADVHRNFATALSEDVVRPLKQLVDSQHRIRKSVETAVDKSGKNLAEWRAAETKAKKNSFTCARENEKLRDSTGDQRTRLSTSSLHIPTKNTPEKETAKMETKRRKAEECVKKADVEYYSVCLRAERSRLEWESAVLRGSHCFQVLEEERLRGLKDLASSYLSNFTHIGPKITQISDRLSEPIKACDLNKDLETVLTLKAATEPSQEQILPDFYPEHTTLAMNRERRKIALVKLLELIRTDLERERRGKAGVENLAVALKRTPTFASEDSQQNVQDKLHHMRSMLTYLEAARYKVLCVLSELEGRSRPSHPLADHIHVSRDRQGYQQSVLKVPSWVHTETEITDWVDRGTADGTSVQPDSDFGFKREPLILKKYTPSREVAKKDEFSSQGSDKDYEPVVSVTSNVPTRCRALYNYTANLYDELSLNPGDIINIHDKQPDGWWLGELNGVVGIFPATYVEEINCSKDTPTRIKGNRNTLLYAAQRGMFEKRLKSPTGFQVLPTYSQVTPGRKVYNPFRTNVDLLEGHTCSPTMFTKTQSPESGDFTWSIDDISRINPAPIDSPTELPEEKIDEQIEQKAQAAIERYFSLRHNIVSPAGGPGQWISPTASRGTPASSSTPCHGRSHRVHDVCTQTVLSLPPVLPPDVEVMLKKYNILIEDEGNEDCDLSSNGNSSLRRKLFFNQEEDSISPVKKVCYNGSGLNGTTKSSRFDWTMEHKTEVLSSPDISPIKSKPEPMCISGPDKEGIFTSTIMCGSLDTGYSTMEQWRSSNFEHNQS